MKDKILYHLATSRTYLALAKAMHSKHYMKSSINQLALARLLILQYNQDKTQEYKIKLVA